MESITPLSHEQSRPFAFLFDTVEKNMGFLPNSMRTMARIPALLGNFSMFAGITLGDPKKVSTMTILKLTFKNMAWSSRFMKSPDRLPVYLRQLVGHMASKAAGCQYCLAHTISEAKHSGASDQQLESIWEFETSTAFNEKERSALRFALAAGSVPNAVTKDHFIELKKHYTQEQIVELGAVISRFGFLNRWNDTFATELEPEPLEVANQLLASKGWSPGKHSLSS